MVVETLDLTTIIAGVTTLSAIVTAAIAALQKIKNGNLIEGISELTNVVKYLDPEDVSVTTAPESEELASRPMLNKMGENQWNEVLDGLSIIEQNTIKAFVAIQETAGLQTFDITTTKGVYTIENGYIEKFEPSVVHESAPSYKYMSDATKEWLTHEQTETESKKILKQVQYAERDKMVKYAIYYNDQNLGDAYYNIENGVQYGGGVPGDKFDTLPAAPTS